MSAAVAVPMPGVASSPGGSSSAPIPTRSTSTPTPAATAARPIYEGEVSTPLRSPPPSASASASAAAPGPAPGLTKLHQSRAQQVKAQALSGSPLALAPAPSAGRAKARPLTSSNAHNLPPSASTPTPNTPTMGKNARDLVGLTTPVGPGSASTKADPSTPALSANASAALAPSGLEDGLTPGKLKRLSLIRDKTKDPAASASSGSAAPAATAAGVGVAAGGVSTSTSTDARSSDPRSLSPPSAGPALTPSTPRRHARQAGLRSSISYSPAFRTGADLGKTLHADGTPGAHPAPHAHLPSTLRGPGTPARGPGTPRLSLDGGGTGGKHSHRVSRSIDGLDELGVGMEPAHEPLHIGGEGVVRGKKEGQNKKGETLSEKHADLLTLIAQKERRVNELKQELAQQEASLATLKARWTSIVSRSAPLFQAPPLTPTASTAGSPSWAMDRKLISSDGTEHSGTTSSPSLSSLTDSEGTSYLHEMRSDAVAEGLWSGLIERALGQGTEQGLISPQAIEGGRRFWGTLMRTMGAAGNGALPADDSEEAREEARSPGDAIKPNIDFAGLQRTITSWTSALASPTPSAGSSAVHAAPQPSNSARLPRARERERDRDRDSTIGPDSPTISTSTAGHSAGPGSPAPGAIRLKRAALGRRLRDLAAGEESESESMGGTPKGAGGGGVRRGGKGEGEKENRQPAGSGAGSGQGAGEGEHEDLWGW